MDETRRNTNGSTEQGNGEIHSDDRIYPPRNGSADQERMSGYASTGYGGVHSGPDHNSGNTGNNGNTGNTGNTGDNGPKTGDKGAALWFALAGLCGCGLVAMAVAPRYKGKRVA